MEKQQNQNQKHSLTMLSLLTQDDADTLENNWFGNFSKGKYGIIIYLSISVHRDRHLHEHLYRNVYGRPGQPNCSSADD